MIDGYIAHIIYVGNTAVCVKMGYPACSSITCMYYSYKYGHQAKLKYSTFHVCYPLWGYDLE